MFSSNATKQLASAANEENEVIVKYVDTSAINLNKLIDGSSVNRPNSSNAIAIQDLVKRLNGSGFRIAMKHIFGFCED